MPKIVTPSMPLKTAVPSDRRISAPAPCAITSGTTPRMKANEVIRIGRSRSRHASTRRLGLGLALAMQLAGELDDQDRVLARQADQHDQADLHEDVDRRPRRQDPDHRAEQAERHDQDHRQRQRPALVERRQGQEDEDDRQGETYIAVFPARICMNINSVHSAFIDRGRVSSERSRRRRRSPRRCWSRRGGSR